MVLQINNNSKSATLPNPSTTSNEVPGPVSKIQKFVSLFFSKEPKTENLLKNRNNAKRSLGLEKSRTELAAYLKKQTNMNIQENHEPTQESNVQKKYDTIALKLGEIHSDLLQKFKEKNLTSKNVTEYTKYLNHVRNTLIQSPDFNKTFGKALTLKVNCLQISLNEVAPK